MRRPSFQFYPADWRNNANLRRCSWEARGVWVEVMGLMHDSDQYGVLQWPLKEIAQALGAPVKLVQELATKAVMKGRDKGECEAFIYCPRHGRKDGAPVTLVVAQNGPIWYSSRMVKDEYVRTIRGESTRFGEAPNPTPKGAPNPPLGDGSTSSSTPTGNTVAKATGVPPDGPDPIFGDGLAYLMRTGIPERAARSFLGKMRKALNDDFLAVELLVKAQQLEVSEPVPWLRAAAQKRMGPSSLGGSNGVAL